MSMPTSRPERASLPCDVASSSCRTASTASKRNEATGQALMDVAETIAPVVRLSAVSVAAPSISPAKEAVALKQKRRLLLIVRLGLSLGVAYLLLFSQGLANVQSFNLTLSAAYLLSNVVIALLPLRLFKSTAFHTGVLL